MVIAIIALVVRLHLYQYRYIKRFVCLSVCLLCFVCPRGGQIFLTHGRHFYFEAGDTNIYIGCTGGYDNVNKEMDVSESIIHVSEDSKLSAGVRIFWEP